MEDKGQKGLKEQRDKRKRIQRIKHGIIAFISIWMILSIVVTGVLCVRVMSLQKQIDILTSQFSSGEVLNEETGSQGDVVTEDDALVSDEGNTGTAESNLADPDDTLKVYLTFDDGPSDNSNDILDILDDYGVKATFFVTGKEDEESTAVYQRIVNEGHTIGMHSYSHKYSEIYSSLDAFSSDFDRIQNLIYDTTGVESVYYRFPGGSSNQVSNTDMSEYIKYLNDKGITYYDWNVSSGDATSQAYTSDELVENVMADVVKYKTSVVLLHDSSSKTATVQALPKLIETLQAAGAMILPISEDTTVVQHVSVAGTDK